MTISPADRTFTLRGVGACVICMKFKPRVILCVESADKGTKMSLHNPRSETVPCICLACNVKSCDSRGRYVLGRFIEAMDGKKFVYCYGCDELVEDSHYILTKTKRKQSLCKKCWEEVYPEWAETYNKLRQRQSTLKAKAQIRKRAKYMTFRRDDLPELCRLAGPHANYEQVERVAREEDTRHTKELTDCTRSLNWMIAYENNSYTTPSPVSVRNVIRPS